MRISDWSSDVCSSDLADGTAKASASVAAMMQPVAGFMSSPPSSFAPVADAQRPGQGVLVDPHEHQGCVVVPGQHHAHLVAIELVFHFPFHAHQRAGLHHPAAAVEGVGAQDRKSTSLNSSHYCAS